VTGRAQQFDVLVATDGSPVAVGRARDGAGAARAATADVLVVGARGHNAVERLLLGSVAQGALDRAPMPVLVVP
jgi:nucleotide-binding universal stress UspA family protein